MRDQARSLIPVPVETLREVLEHMPLGLAVFDPDRRLEMWNEAVIRLLRLPRDKVVRGQTIDWFMHYWAQQGVFGQGDHDEIVAGRLARIYSGQVRRSELGSIDTFVLEVSFHLLPDGRLVCIYADVSDRKRRNRQIRDLAYNDDLTGLPNRPAFFEALHRLLDLRQVFTLAIVDLDGFKSINDRHGHAAGDRILEAVADRCRPLLGHEDVMGRIGGDEFALLLPERRGGAAGQAAGLLAGLRAACAAPIDIPGDGRAAGSPATGSPVTGPLTIGMSIGAAHHPEDGTSAAALLRCADRRMYSDKNSRRAAR